MKKIYNRRTWLNNNNSPSTGSVVCYDGDVDFSGEIIRSTFISISDCSKSAKLHIAEYDTIEDFIEKLKILNNEISKFIVHLENNK